MASTRRLAPAVDCDEPPSSQKENPTDGSNRPERMRGAQRESIKRSGKKHCPADPASRRSRDQRANASGGAGVSSCGQSEQSHRVDKMIEHSSLPQTHRLELEQGILQRMSAKCSEDHSGRPDQPSQEEQSVL